MSVEGSEGVPGRRKAQGLKSLWENRDFVSLVPQGRLNLAQDAVLGTA